MNRRNFIKGMIAVAATAAVAPKFIWNPTPAIPSRLIYFRMDEEAVREYLAGYRELDRTYIVMPPTREISFSPDGGRTWVPMGSPEAHELVNRKSWASQFEIGDATA